MNRPPKHARAVIIGGGIAGCSLAYHLAHQGWQDVVLLERKQLTCGTTWHAAGLIGQLRPTYGLTRLTKYSAELYSRLEEETGLATGYTRSGSISVSLTEARQEELLRQASLARAYGVECEILSPAELAASYPHVKTDDVKGAIHLPGDGQCDPGNTALALAKGARMKGVQIFENTKVTAIECHGRKAQKIHYEREGEQGEIQLDHLVNCAGMWARELGAQNNVHIPLHACEHFYLITEPMAGLTRSPALRVPDECAYYKEDAGKILLGAFELRAKPWGMDGIPDDFSFDELAEDFDHFQPILDQAINRMPALADAGIRKFFSGPESFTADGNYYMGPAPNYDNYWVAAGFNSIGIVTSGGAGQALARWMEDGIPPCDLWSTDIRRVAPFQTNRRYLGERVSETLGLLYADHFPFRQMASARNVRRSPIHEQLKQRGAVFGELAGWERANWFADEGQEPEYQYSWQRPAWFDNVRNEHLSVRENVGLFDLSSFGKIWVEGPGARDLLQYLCANQIDVTPGRIIYTQMLNEMGQIESDLTVTRLGEQTFLLVVPAANLYRDIDWLRRHLQTRAHVTIMDVTSAEAVFALAGPNARRVLGLCSPDDISTPAFPFGQIRNIEIGLGQARAHRISYHGELGYELYVSSDQAAHIFETLMAAGDNHDMKLCGLHALDSCRMEKAFRHLGHDITDDDHILEAGLGFAANMKKGEFLGREAILAKKENGLSQRLAQFLLKDSAPILYGHETIFRDGVPVAHLASAAYGHYLGGAVGLGYIPCEGESISDLKQAHYEIDIAGTRSPAQISFTPLYDPSAERMRL